MQYPPGVSNKTYIKLQQDFNISDDRKGGSLVIGSCYFF